MKPAPFAYHRADSVADALQQLAADDEAKPLSGGQSLLAVMNLRLSRPTVVVDLNGLGELDRIFDDKDSLVIGARCTHRRVETDEVVATRLPLLREAASRVGHVAIRNQGTIGGSVAHADPAAEIPAVLLALGATLYLDRHASSRRELAASDFFVSYYTTALKAGELLTWLRVPTLPSGAGWGFHEIARRHGDFASAGAVAILDTDTDTDTDTESVRSARCVVFGVSDRPLQFDLEQLNPVALADDQAWARAVDRTAQAIAESLEPPDQPDLKRRHAHRAVTVALDQARFRVQGRGQAA